MDTTSRHLTGQTGVIVETGTTGYANLNCYTIQILADTVFAIFTEEGATGDAMTGFTISAPTEICGRITAFQLTSGKVRAHVEADPA